MRVTSPSASVLIAVSVLLAAFTDACANGPPARADEGRDLLARHCAKCHAIDKTAQSKLRQATPLRDVYRRYPLERLEFELSEGIGSTHPDMPQIQFSTEQIGKIVEYLDGLVGTE